MQTDQRGDPNDIASARSYNTYRRLFFPNTTFLLALKCVVIHSPARWSRAVLPVGQPRAARRSCLRWRGPQRRAPPAKLPAQVGSCCSSWTLLPRILPPRCRRPRRPPPSLWGGRRACSLGASRCCCRRVVAAPVLPATRHDGRPPPHPPPPPPRALLLQAGRRRLLGTPLQPPLRQCSDSGSNVQTSCSRLLPRRHDCTAQPGRVCLRPPQLLRPAPAAIQLLLHQQNMHRGLSFSPTVAFQF